MMIYQGYMILIVFLAHWHIIGRLIKVPMDIYIFKSQTTKIRRILW
jgi:hypothetical protein